MDLVPAGGCEATGSGPDLDGMTAKFGHRVSRFVCHRYAPLFGGAVPGRVGLTAGPRGEFGRVLDVVWQCHRDCGWADRIIESEGCFEPCVVVVQHEISPRKCT